MIDLTAILSTPEDDGPRKAVASGLEAAGDPRGRFITVQLLAAEERKTRGATPDYWSLDATAEAMLARHGGEWSSGVSRYATAVRFARGFVEQVTMDARAFLDKGDEIYRLAPIRSVVLTGAKSVMRELAESSLLHRLVDLALFDNRIGDDGVAALVGSRQLKNLRLLDLGFNDVTRIGLDVLAASPTMRKLVFINLAGNPCGDPGETFGVDAMTGRMVPGSSELPPLGQQLEAKYGDLPWLHGPSRILSYPPTFEDV